MFQRKVKTSRRRWVENTLLLIGVIAVWVWAWEMASITVFQNWEDWVFNRQRQGKTATITEYMAEKKDSVVEAARAWLGIAKDQGTPKSPILNPSIPSPRVRPPAISRDGLIGRLVIPRLHVSEMVREGADEGTLRLALGHIPGTALPGQMGNIGVAGHRDTLFRGLRRIEKNDVIRFETLAGTYVYQVEGTEIVKPRDVNVLKVRGYPEMTLVTCYPFNYIGSAPDRFIVKARLLPAGRLEQQAEASAMEQQADHPTGGRRHSESSDTLAVRDSGRNFRERTDNGIEKITFELNTHHSRRLTEAVSLGVTTTDVPHRRLSGWMWVMPDRRTIWFRNQSVRDPVVFYGFADGKQRKLVITGITNNAVRGYFLFPENRTDRNTLSPATKPGD